MTEGRKILRPINWIIIFVVLLYFVSVAAAYDGLEWENGTSGTLKRNEVISFGDYSVKVVAFSAPVESEKYKQIPIEPVEPFVGLNISKNGSFLNTTFLAQGDSFISADSEFKVEVVQLPSGSSKDWLYESYNPWTKLQLSKRGKPQLELSIETDDEYISGPNTEIDAVIVLRNTGTAAINNIDLDLSTELPILRGYLKYHYETLMKGEEISEAVTFSTPGVTDLKKYNIFANFSGVDVKDVSYKATQLKTILIAPPLEQAPSLTKNTNAKAYLKDLIMVSISFKNNADYELKNVSIVDSVPKGFKQLSNNTLHWVVNVGPNKEWYFRYLLKPTGAGNVIFPSTTAEFDMKNEYYMIQSNRPETKIYGPRIELSKQADKTEINPGDEVTVTVIAKNSGTTPTMVTIKDDLPLNTTITLISGTTTLEEYLEAGKESSLSYTLSSNSAEPIELPPAKAEYFELGSQGLKLTTMSEKLLIGISPPPTPEPTPEPTPDPAFEIPDNSTEGAIDQEEAGYAVDPGQETEQPIIVEPIPTFDDANSVLNLLMGCDKNDGTVPRINMTTDVCALVGNTPMGNTPVENNP
ncbi:hypothetical protein METP3_02679 [Methanosarcinales archaeon]|nr:hypothetical protein METP3_02679 [Methanosarcinales archaeon]